MVNPLREDYQAVFLDAVIFLTVLKYENLAKNSLFLEALSIFKDFYFI